MPPPLVSVLMTVYNREKYVAAAIESVLAQTMTDFELIVSDDCSSDSSVEIARRYERDSRVRVIVNDRNLGDYPNRNKAASLARGKYLKYVDADDIIYPHCLGIMTEALEQFPEAGIALSLAPRAYWICPALLSPRDAYIEHFFGRGMLASGPDDALIRRDAFEAAGRFDDARYTGDFKCWLAMARARPVVVTVGGLVWWRHHERQESVLETQDLVASAETRGRFFRIVLDALHHSDCPLSFSERHAAANNAWRDFCRALLFHLRRGNVKAARAFWHSSGLAFGCSNGSSPPRRGKGWVSDPEVGLRAIAGVGDLRYAFHRKCGVDGYPPPSPKQTPVWLTRDDGLREAESGNRKPEEARVRQPSTIDHQPSTISRRPLVSVLIPARNCEEYIGLAIKSVLAQSFTDWELIVVDDCSADGAYEVAQSYADGNRIRCYCNETRLGKWDNHNRCAERARGKYLKFLHADDLLYPHCLKIMAYMMEKSGAGIGVSVAHVNSPAGTVFTPGETFRQEFRSHPLLQEGVTPSIYRSDFFRQIGGFNSDYEPACRRLALNLAAIADCVVMPAGLYWVRRHAGIGPRLASSWEQSEIQGGAWLRDMIASNDCPLTPEEKTSIIAGLRGRAARMAVGSFLSGRIVRARRIWREQKLTPNARRDIFAEKPWLDRQTRHAPYREESPCDLAMFPRIYSQGIKAQRGRAATNNNCCSSA